MLINLVPQFLSTIRAADPVEAYHRYLEGHKAVLGSYWRNYVIDPEHPHAETVIRQVVDADRTDLETLLFGVDVAQMVEEALERARDVLHIDIPADVYLMVGVGAANAGELVVNGRGAAFICLEHFTGQPNPTTFGMGLNPELIPLWVGHELAHVVRYGSPDSRSVFRRLIAENAGNLDRWGFANRATLREMLLNEGLAVHAARAVAPGFPAADYLGYSRGILNRMRELESFLRRTAESDLDASGLGLQLRWLTDGSSPSARLAGGRVLPERSGYYLGWRMAEALVTDRGIAAALRASVDEFAPAEHAARQLRSA